MSWAAGGSHGVDGAGLTTPDADIQDWTDYHLVDGLPYFDYKVEKVMLMKRNLHPAVVPCEAIGMGEF